MSEQVVFYQESRGNNTGDYLSVAVANGKTPSGTYDARATAIKGNVSSVCSTTVHPNYLKCSCRKVDKQNVPANWRKALSWD